MKKLGFAAAAALTAALFVPTVASAATGYVTTDLNVRAGPSTQYPAVSVFPGGSVVDVIGCTSGPGWCDVRAGGVRGWVSASYLDLGYQNQRYAAPQVIGRVGVPTVSFSIGSYWNDHYRGRAFYNDRARFGGPRAVGPRRAERIENRIERRQEIRQEIRRDARQDARQEIRQDRREARQELRQDRREARQELRQERRENRQELRQDRRLIRQLR